MHRRATGKAVIEEKRENAAVAEARYRLGPIVLDIVYWTNQGIQTPDPVKERHHSIAMVKQVAAELERDLYPNPTQTQIGIQEELPAARFCAAILRAALPGLERTRPAKKHDGRSADLWCQRNRLIAETRELICRKHDLPQERGTALIKQALEELVDWFEKAGLKKPKVPLSESRIREICRTWK